MDINPKGSDKNTYYGTMHVPVDGFLQNDGGRIVGVIRITEDTTLNSSHHNIFADTDSGAFTITLAAGIEGTKLRIINVGSSGLDVTVAPNGAELLIGSNSSNTLSDGSVIELVYETTEGWW